MRGTAPPGAARLLTIALLLVAVMACSRDGVEPRSSPADGSTTPPAGSPGDDAPRPDPGDPDGLEPPRNPFLADSPWPASHRSSYNQASSPLPGPTGAEGAVELLEAAPTAITLAYGPADETGSAAVWASTFTTVAKGVSSVDGEIEVVDELDDPPQLPPASGPTGAITAAYTLVDVDGVFYSARGRRVTSYTDAVEGDPSSPIEKGPSADLDAVLDQDDALVALSITWDGTLVAASRLGTMVAIDRSMQLVDQIRLAGGRDISNSIAVDEDGGIYVTSADRQHRVQWTGDGLSTDEADGAWTAPYDGGGDVPAPGRLGTGSGTTPSLMGTSLDEDRLVVIADGAPIMHLVAFWRDTVPDGWQPIAPGRDRRIAAEVAISFGAEAPVRSITEQSPVVRGYQAMVVSNAYGPPYDRPSSSGAVAAILASGGPAVQPHGAELFRWDPAADQMSSVWANEELSCPNGIPSMSGATGLAYCYGARDGTWTLEAIDWTTGEPRFSVPLGEGNRWNSFYAATEIGPGASIASGSFGGIVSVAPAS